MAFVKIWDLSISPLNSQTSSAFIMLMFRHPKAFSMWDGNRIIHILMNYLPDISYPLGGMIRETMLLFITDNCLQSLTQGEAFFYGFGINFGMGIFLHLSALPQGQTTYPSTGETSSLCALHNCGFPAPLCSPYQEVSLLLCLFRAVVPPARWT